MGVWKVRTIGSASEEEEDLCENSWWWDGSSQFPAAEAASVVVGPFPRQVGLPGAVSLLCCVIRSCWHLGQEVA